MADDETIFKEGAAETPEEEAARKEARKAAKKARQKAEKAAKKEAAEKAKKEAEAKAKEEAAEEAVRKQKERAERAALDIEEAAAAMEELAILSEEKEDETDFTTNETRSQVEQRHEAELRELRKKAKGLLKVARKNKDKQQEAEGMAIKMEHELEKRQRKELEYLDERGDVEETGEGQAAEQVDPEELKRQKEEEEKKRKLDKKMRKRNKKKAEEQERERQKEEDRANAVSLRDVELDAINAKLKSASLHVKEIPSDGNCMFRAVIDQVDALHLRSTVLTDEGSTHATIRRLAVRSMRESPDAYAPFLSEEDLDAGFESYCTKMETTAAWGGQLELQAIAKALGCEVWVHSSEGPTVKMGAEHASAGRPALQLSYV